MITAVHHPHYKQRNKAQELQTASPDKYPQGYFKEKPCRHCGVFFEPRAPSHMYCSQLCADTGMTNKRLKKEYGLTNEDVLIMYEKQEHKCAICGTEGFSLNKAYQLKLVVDHCHTTGVVRGMLCHNCNRALGLMQDDVNILQNAINYLTMSTDRVQ
jgi:hypothetical protein